MEGRRFDALVRGAVTPGCSRRDLALGLAVGAAAGLFRPAGVAATPGARPQRSRGRHKVVICHKGKSISVAEAAAAAHLERHRGDHPGACGLAGGAQSCENPTQLCSTRYNICDENGVCACLWTTTSGTICAFLGGGKCLDNNDGCLVDSDCAEFGSGWACVPTYACDPDQRCGGNGNICAPPCQG